MNPFAAIMSVLLITVTGNGQVHHANFNTKATCEEARNIALYGETIEAGKAIDEAQEKSSLEPAADWRKFHPCHAPKSKADWQVWNDHKKANGFSSGFGMDIGGGNIFSNVENGKICDYQGGGVSWLRTFNPSNGEWIQESHGVTITKYPTDVKTAECLDGASAKED